MITDNGSHIPVDPFVLLNLTELVRPCASYYSNLEVLSVKNGAWIC